MNKKITIGLQLSGIFLSILIGNCAPVRSMENHAKPTNNHHLRIIEQPLSTKILVTASGLALIGLELWWFLLSKPKAKKATINILKN